jgi:sialate O-acetylesterase
MEWKEINYDDRDWKNVHVPAYWETQGFKDYDGYAWYRVAFKVPADYEGRSLIALVGKIDDFDEVYLNGERIGRTGPMPKCPMHHTDSDEYLQMRAYTIPAGVVLPGKENVLAVRVYDCWQGGGIYEGPVGIVTKQHYLKSKRTLWRVEEWFENLFDDIFD